MSQDDSAGMGPDNPDHELARMMSEGRSFSARERNVCLLNAAGGPGEGRRFADISALTGLDYKDDGRAVALVDWDHDGDQDLWISNRNAPRLRLMRNDIPGTNHFLALSLQGNGTSTSRDAIGARVEVVLAGDHPRLARTLRAGEGFLAQSSKWLHFGLGAATTIETVIVDWPGGEKERFSGLKSGGRHRLVQGRGLSREVTAPGFIRETVLASSVQETLAEDRAARLPMVELLPVPTLNYLSLGGVERTLLPADGSWKLLNLWASWCAPCLQELDQFAERHEEMRAKGIEILALTVDGLEDNAGNINQAASLISARAFPFSTGRATYSLIEDLELLSDIRFALHVPLPLPCSFLIDPEGRLFVIYRGPVSVDQLLADVGRPAGTLFERWVGAAPLGGIPLKHTRVAGQARNWAVTLRLRMAEHLREKERYEDAALQYADALRLKPGLVGARLGLGNALQSMARFEEAIPHYEEVLRLRPGFSAAHSNLGSVLLQLKRPAEAAKCYRDAIRSDPNLPGAHYNLGNALHDLGQFEEAVLHYREAVRLNPDFAEAYFNLGNILARLRRYAEAAESFQGALRSVPGYAAAHYNLGATLKALGREQDAEFHFQEAQRLGQEQ